jgi:hypothetical protein
VAWISLGHPPRPNLDDPKHIGGVFDLFYAIGGLALMTAPVGIAGLVGGMAFIPKWVQERGWSMGKGALMMAMLLGLYGGALLLLLWDPVGALGWFLDCGMGWGKT